MKRILLINIVLALVGRGQNQVDENTIRKAACDHIHDTVFPKVFESVKCGTPREAYVKIPTPAPHIDVTPDFVWLKRCIGFCDYYNIDVPCLPIKVSVQAVEVSLFNVKTQKKTCGTYNMEVHELCGCCDADTNTTCEAPRVFNARRCACTCPNKQDRADCVKQTDTMKWNRRNCVCEPKSKRRKRHTLQDAFRGDVWDENLLEYTFE